MWIRCGSPRLPQPRLPTQRWPPGVAQEQSQRVFPDTCVLMKGPSGRAERTQAFPEENTCREKGIISWAGAGSALPKAPLSHLRSTSRFASADSNEILLLCK